MSAKTKDISSKIELLQERLEEENVTSNVIPPFTPKLGSQSRRPNNRTNFFFIIIFEIDFHFQCNNQIVVFCFISY